MATLQSLDTIAKLIELTPRRIQQLSAEGFIPKAQRGQYDLVGAVRGYIKYLKERGEGDENDAASFAKHRARLTRERADLAAIERRQLMQELIPASQIEAAWGTVVSTMRARLRNIPSKVSPRLAAIIHVADIKAILQQEIDEALSALAEVAIETASEGSRSSGSVEDREAGLRDMPTASETDGRLVG